MEFRPGEIDGVLWRPLKKFHDAFLAEGAAPLPLVRAALLK